MRILIPTMGPSQHLRLTLDALRFTAPNVPITVVATLDPNYEWPPRPSVQVIQTMETDSLPKINIGIEQTDDDLVLCNDDIVPLTQDWSQILQDHIKHLEARLAAIGARSNNTMRHQLADIEGPPVERVPIISSVFMLMTRHALNELGGFDSALTGGIGDDLEWSYRATQAGYDVLLDRRLFVWHWGQQTAGPYGWHSEQSERNVAYLKAKYPEMQTEVPA